MIYIVKRSFVWNGRERAIGDFIEAPLEIHPGIAETFLRSGRLDCAPSAPLADPKTAVVMDQVKAPAATPKKGKKR